MTAMFRLENVSKNYTRRGRAVIAFATDSLTIAKGDYTAIVGPSGSGKTTLLSMLGGMLAPDAGKVWLGDDSLYDLPVKKRTALRRETIGFVFQTFNLVPYLKAWENVAVPLYLDGWTPSEQRERAMLLLEQVGLGDRLDHKPFELSIGQQQRVALARTLANEPSVILADEPTGNLDAENRARVLDFFDELHRQGRTIVMVTHDQTAANRARSMLALRDGLVHSTVTSAAVRAA
jgi:putative ABC transport system ATP-binding protein